MSYLKLVASETSPDNSAYAEAIEQLDAGVCIIDRHGSVLANNQIFRRLLDLPFDWAKPKTDVTPVPASAQLVSGWLARVASDGSFTQTVAMPEGRSLRVEGKALPSGGVSLNLTETAAESAPAPEITQQAAGRRAQMESEIRLRTLLDYSPDSISLKDAEGRFLIVNKACEQILGLSVEKMLGRTIWDVLPDGDWRGSDAGDARLLSGEDEVYNDELPVDIPGRGRCILRRTKFPVLGDDGRPIGVGTITSDVTQQIEAREQLRRNEAGFKNAQQIARMGNVERNFVTDEAYWSDGVFSIFDIEKRRTVPDFDEVMDHVHPEDRGIYGGMWAAMKAGEASQDVDFRLIRPTGEVRFVHELLEADYDAEGSLTHCVAVIQDVSEAKLAEVALRDSEQRFRSIIDNLPSAVSLKDRDHRFISVNKSFENLYGRTEESVVGEPLLSAMPEQNDWATIIAADQDILDGERTTYEDLITLRFNDGALRSFDMRKFPVTDADGRISAVGTISTDISERLQAEHRVRDSEERFRSLVDNLPNTVTVKGLDGRFTLVNTAFAQMVGQPPDAIIGQTIGDVVPDMDVELSDSMDVRICNGEEDFITDEYSLTLPNGEQRHIHMTKFPVTGSSGRCTGVGTILTDLTARRRAEHRVRESEAKFHAIFEQAGLGIGVVGRDGNFLDVNSALAEMFGLTPDEMIGEGIASLTIDDDRDRSREEFNALLNKENDIARFEKRYLRKGGEPFEAKLTSSVVFDEDDEFKFTVALVEDVTERRKSERALRASEERLRAITDNSPAAIYLKDPDGKFIFANRIWHDTYNPGGEDIVGKIVGDFISSETAEQAAAADAKVLETGVPIVEEQHLPNAAGKWQNLLASKFPVRDEDGNIVAIGGVNTDITDRVAAEKALRDSEAHLAHAQRIAKLGSWVWDPETDKVTWSDALYRLMQIDPETAADPADAFFARVHPDDRARVEQSRKQLNQFGHQQLVPYRIILPSGEERTIHTQWVVENDATGQPVRAIGITQDVTEADQAELALRESEQWFRAVIDNVPATLTLKNPDGTFRYVNKQFREWYDLSLEETVGRTGHELFAGEVADAVDDLDQAVLETGDAVQAEIPATFADGSAHTLLANKFLVRDDDGTVIGNGLVGYDITHAKHTEEMLRQAQKMEAVGQLTGGVAHDFNNLLAVVIGNLELVADHLQADTPAFDYVRNAFRAAERGASLTHHLLAFARQQVLQPVETDLTTLIADTKALMSVSMGEKITVELKTGDGLWHCKVDQAQLQNAILNLSINARDAMPSGGSVTIGAENTRLNAARAEDLELDEGDYVCLSVSDNGPGIPEDVIEHVYEPFFTTKDVGEGSGLGLSMVYGFVQQSGGGVEIETGEGEGTSVKLYFPAIVPDEPKAVESSTNIQDLGTEPQATILLVEDNEAFRQVTRTLLESLHFRVIDFGTAGEALKVIGDTTPFDLLLSDIGLPGDMDGHELAQFAASARPGLKIILMSAHTDMAFSGGIIDSNVAAFLRKPHRKADLSQTLHQVLGFDT